MRPLIQYDLDEPPTTPAAPPQPTARRPPTKKRKRNHNKSQKNPSAQSPKLPLQHWDDPGSAVLRMFYGEELASKSTMIPMTTGGFAYFDDEGEDEGEDEDEAVEDEEESRPLTCEEIWDDSALIDAWNSAEAEYEAYHGTSKSWKSEPIKKSPLWYNKPRNVTLQPKSKSCPKSTVQRPEEQEDHQPEPDTAPLDFNTYVPTHDPSLGVPPDTGAQPATDALFFPPPSSTTMVSRDEAFNNALSAMYWSGYWTAVYHCQSQSSGKDSSETRATTEENEIGADEDKDEDEDEEDLVPAQR